MNLPNAGTTGGTRERTRIFPETATPDQISGLYDVIVSRLLGNDPESTLQRQIMVSFLEKATKNAFKDTHDFRRKMSSWFFEHPPTNRDLKTGPRTGELQAI